MGIDILGIDIVGVDILGIDIPAPTPTRHVHRKSFDKQLNYRDLKNLKILNIEDI